MPTHDGVVQRDISSRIESILSVAESDFRTLIEECLVAHAYGGMAIIAEMADAVSALRARVASEGRTADQDADGKSAGNNYAPSITERNAGTAIVPAGGRRGKKNVEYPQFEREGERLVKIGWSKRDRSVYEHKAPFTAVVATCRALREISKPFTMDEILPLRDGAGADVPSYQVYLVVAWLRRLGLVERNGNEGYTAHRDGLGDDAVAQALRALPARR